MILNFKAAIMTAVLLYPILNHAQDANPVEVKKDKKFEADFEGILGLSYGNDTFGINVGGPSLKFKLTPKLKIGVGAFPSLIFVDDRAYPRLAVSPILEYNKWMLITPYYGYDAKDEPIWTFGLGYRFL